MNKEVHKQKSKAKNRDAKGKFKAGASGNPNGRPKGSLNRFTNLKDAFLGAFEDLGGRKGLVKWAKESKINKRTYYQLIAKMLPSNVSISNPGESMNFNITFKDEDEDDDNGAKSES